MFLSYITSDRTSWNMDANLLQEALDNRAKLGKLPKAVVLVHLYGQSADIDPILKACQQYNVCHFSQIFTSMVVEDKVK